MPLPAFITFAGRERRPCKPIFGLIEQFSTALLNPLCLMRLRIFCLSRIHHQAQLQNVLRATDQIIFSLTCFWVLHSLKKCNGVKTLSALQGHYLWSVMLLLNHLLSSCRDPCGFIFMPSTILRKEQLGMGFTLCNVMIFNTYDNNVAASLAVLRRPVSVLLLLRTVALGGSWTCTLICMQIP